MKKKFKDTKLGKLVGGLIGDALQVSPVIGTIVTTFRNNQPGSPKGKVSIGKSEIIRILIGLFVGYLMYKGVEAEFILDVVETTKEAVK